jgi:hypothetical protein
MQVDARSPVVIGYADNLKLTSDFVWIDSALIPGNTYRLRALLDGSDQAQDNGALICVDQADRAGGEGLRISRSVGAHLYLRTGSGLHRTDRLFSVASPARRFGVRAWGDRGESTLKTLTIERVDGTVRPTDFFFSFDVEAGLNRAYSDHIDTLVWGKLEGGEYGIGRICDVLEQHGLKGNFLIDFATCAFEGEARLRRIVDFLAGRGHEIHMHLHPEWLARRWGLRARRGEQVHFGSMSYDLTMRVLDHTATMYERFVGLAPRVFRSGSYRTNPALVLAAGSLGFDALSNICKKMVGDPTIGGDVVIEREPFEWENGVLEIPVDTSSPEVGDPDDYQLKYQNAMRRKATEKTFNLVMHSWSLTRRNPEDRHDAYEPAYEERLHQICDHAKKHGVTRGYSEYIDSRRITRPRMRLVEIQLPTVDEPVYEISANIVSCNMCGAIFARLLECPSCGLGPRQRALKDVLDTFGNVFNGRSVLTLQMTPVERREFLAGAVRIKEVVPRSEAGSGASVLAGIELLPAGSFDSFVSVKMFRNGDPDGWLADSGLIAEIVRVLKPRGLLVAAAPLLSQEIPRALLADFDATLVPGLDRVTDTAYRVIFAYKRPAGAQAISAQAISWLGRQGVMRFISRRPR